MNLAKYLTKGAVRAFRNPPFMLTGSSFWYVPIPKIASTSMKRWLYHNDFGREFPSYWEGKKFVDHWIEVHDIYPFKNGVNKITNKKLICLIRDPISRFKSLYRNRILHARDLDTNMIKSNKLKVIPSVDFLIDKFSDYKKLNRKFRQHAKSQSDFLGPNDYEHVFKLDELDKLKKFLKEINNKIPFLHKKTGGADLKSVNLSAKNIKQLEKIYEKDFEIYYDS